ncbi:MAG: type II secretion system protein GspL [Proteobacteria bacterium]|nr:type II secretion system protein GspL [Pseudomonadota bacterium]
MPIYNILRVDVDGEPEVLYQYDTQLKSSQIKNLTKWQDSLLKLHSDIIVLLPAQWVYLTKTKIPSKSQEVLKQSIPFAIEEELSNEIEDNYFSFKPIGEHEQNVAVIEKGKFFSLMEKLEKNSLKVTQIFSEMVMCPSLDITTTIVINDKHALIRLTENQGMAVQIDQIVQMVNLFSSDNKQLRIFDPKNEVDISGINLQLGDGLSESDCFESVLNADNVNLIINIQQQQKQQSQRNPYRKTIIVASLLLLSWIIVSVINSMTLSTKLAEIKNQQSQIFKQAIGEVSESELIDPYASMQSRLKLIGKNSSTQRSAFLDAMSYLGKTLETNKLIALNSIRMVDNKIELNIAANNMTIINNFHQQLKNMSYGFKVMIGVNELENDSYKSIIVMEKL